MKFNRSPWIIVGLAAIAVNAPQLTKPVLAQDAAKIPDITTQETTTTAENLVIPDAQVAGTSGTAEDLVIPETHAKPAPLTAQVDETIEETVQPKSFQLGRATQGGSSYIGAGANIGALGNSSLGKTSFAVLSKVGLTKTFSARPSIVTNFRDDATFTLPATYDFAPIRLDSSEQSIKLAPYIGAGAAINTDGDFGPLVTGGLDIRHWFRKMG